MTLWNFYFQLFEKAVGKEETVLFLGYLIQRISSPLLIVWDRLPAHRSRLVGEFLDQLQGWIVTEYLPPYAPELNPVEYLWGHWKHADQSEPKWRSSACLHMPGSGAGIRGCDLVCIHDQYKSFTGEARKQRTPMSRMINSRSSERCCQTFGGGCILPSGGSGHR